MCVEQKLEVLVGDKDFADRIVFKEKFPSTKIQVCLFHALRTFKREEPNITDIYRP